MNAVANIAPATGENTPQERQGYKPKPQRACCASCSFHSGNLSVTGAVGRVVYGSIPVCTIGGFIVVDGGLCYCWSPAS